MIFCIEVDPVSLTPSQFFFCYDRGPIKVAQIPFLKRLTFSFANNYLLWIAIETKSQLITTPGAIESVFDISVGEYVKPGVKCGFMFTAKNKSEWINAQTYPTNHSGRILYDFSSYGIRYDYRY